MKRTVVVSAFPGVGKSWVCINQEEFDITCLDSDSSCFHWSVNTARIKVKNPDFPSNYINHIKENIGKYDIIFTSSHDFVREAMGRENIPYVLVYPDESLKNEYIGRYYLRGSDSHFLWTLDKFFNEWVKSCREDIHAAITIELNSHTQYLANLIPQLKVFSCLDLSTPYNEIIKMYNSYILSNTITGNKEKLPTLIVRN